MLLCFLTSVAGFVVPPYQRTATLSPSYQIFWSVDKPKIELAFLVQQTEGWIGFGISEAGGMGGSDMAVAILQSNPANPIALQDRHSLGHSEPLLDSKPGENDWVLTGTERNSTHTLVQVSRALDTGDKVQDRLILDNGLPTHVIGAFGSLTALTNQMTWHGKDNKVSSSIDFFSENPDHMSPSGTHDPTVGLDKTKRFSVLNNFVIPAEETTYHETCKMVNELPEINGKYTSKEEFYVIGMEHSVNLDSEQYVHHFLVFLTSNCGEPRGPMVYGWAPGVSELPNNINLPTGLFASTSLAFTLIKKTCSLLLFVFLIVAVVLLAIVCSDPWNKIS
jgi:hypothetical protein